MARTELLSNVGLLLPAPQQSLKTPPLLPHILNFRLCQSEESRMAPSFNFNMCFSKGPQECTFVDGGLSVLSFQCRGDMEQCKRDRPGLSSLMPHGKKSPEPYGLHLLNMTIKMKRLQIYLHKDLINV